MLTYKIKNILFRADSSSFIGTGHIMRDLVLAKQFENSNIIFATQNLKGNVNHKILEADFNIELLKSNNFDELDKLVKKSNIDILVIDHYDIDYIFEKRLKELNPKLKILSFDDTYEKHSCDILLNHNIYAKKKNYKGLVPNGCELRCGIKYTLLREEFLKEKRKKKKKNNKQINIFISMGGADVLNLNIKILKVLEKVDREISFNMKIILLTTSANEKLEDLKRYCKNRNWVDLHINSNNVALLMRESDLGIITPSVTANEMSFLNKEFISIKVAKNQKYMYEFLKKNNMTMKSFDKKLLLKKVRHFIRRWKMK